MTNHPGDIVLKLYLDGSCTQTELQKVEAWLDEDSVHADKLEQFASRNTGDDSEMNTEQVKAGLFQQIDDEESSAADTSVQKEAPKVKKRNTRGYSEKKRTHWVAAAAIIFLMLSSLVGLYVHQSRNIEQEPVVEERSVPAGKTLNLTLEDGSKVLLNSGSSIKFNKPFSKDSREVLLTGEAFFEVEADKNRPFKVHTGSLKTTVLGTAFNVKAFPKERKVQVAVEQGRVSVERRTDNASVNKESATVLKPNQWVTFDRESKNLKKEFGNIYEMIAWKDGVVFFHNKSVNDLVPILKRWYGIDIMIENNAIKECVMHGTYKEESLENVLKAMQFALNIDYEITKETITLTGGQCK